MRDEDLDPDEEEECARCERDGKIMCDCEPDYEAMVADRAEWLS